MIKRLLIHILLLCFSYQGFSQLQPLLNQYLLNGLAINPAYAGSQDALSLGLYSRNQWVGFEGAPRTITFSMHSPMRNKKVNLGLILLNDKLGSRKETGFLFNYAYRIEMGSGNFSLGLATGVTGLSSDLDAVKFVDPGDDYVQNNAGKVFLPEFSFGSYYYSKKYFVGISMPLFSTFLLDDDPNDFHVGFDLANTNYILTGGYIFKLSEEIEIFPTLFMKMNPANSTQLDMHCSVIFKEKVWLGAGIRSNGNLSALLNLQVNTQLRVGYSYGYELSELSSYNSGSHEVVLQYNFNYLLEVVSPRYF